MVLRFEDRPYSGKSFRPRPEIHVDPQSGLVIVATPWGARSSARAVIDRMTDYLSLAREDREVTSPFARQSCLSQQANNLRIATLLANSALYNDDNRLEYKSGVELFAALVNDHEFVFVQSGQPQVLLGRPGRMLTPLGSQIDLALDLSEGEELLAPLPAQLLGLDTSVNMIINSFRARPGDRIVLLSHSHTPDALFRMKREETSLEALSLTIAKTHPDLAFWLGILDIEQDATTHTKYDATEEAS